MRHSKSNQEVPAIITTTVNSSNMSSMNNARIFARNTPIWEQQAREWAFSSQTVAVDGDRLRVELDVSEGGVDNENVRVCIFGHTYLKPTNDDYNDPVTLDSPGQLPCYAVYEDGRHSAYLLSHTTRRDGWEHAGNGMAYWKFMNSLHRNNIVKLVDAFWEWVVMA